MDRITKRLVDASAPEARRYIIWDSELKGFGLRVAPTGTKTYIVRYRPRGVGQGAPKRFVVLGRHGPITPDEARARAKAILGQVAAGCDPVKNKAEARQIMTVAALVGVFLEQHVKLKRKASTARGYSDMLNKRMLPKFGKQAADLLTRDDIAQIHFAMKDRPYAANRFLAITASMYGFAVRRGLLLKGTNPTEGIERYREQGRERYLTAAELKRLGETLRLAETQGLPWALDRQKPLSKHLAKETNQNTIFASEVVLAFRLLIFTGARLREILHLEWQHVDLDRGLLLLPDSKTGQKTIVLSAPALDLLRARNFRCRFVIPSSDEDRPRSDLKKPWQAVQRHAGLKGVRIHDLRHTFASIGAGASLGLPIVGKLLGHTQPATTARYAHLDADPLRRATDLIGGRLAMAMAKT